MLEFFRRHRGAFLISLTIIIIITFSVWGGYRGGDKSGVPTALPSDHAMSVYGKDYNIGEVSEINRLLQFGMQHLQMYDLYFTLSGMSRGSSNPGGAGIIGSVIVLRDLLEKSGVRASDAEALEELKKLPALQSNGQFDMAQAQRMEETAGAYGMTSQEILELMRLKAGLNKLQDLAGKNYAASTIAAEKQYVNAHQVMKLSTITFNTDDYKKDVKVTDEEIQKYYDENKDGYKSTEKRAVKYVFFPNPTDLDKKPLEERQKLQKEISDRVNAFSDRVLKDDRQANLETIAKDLKEKVETLPAFAQDAPPEAIKAEAALITAIFQQAKTQPVSDALKSEKGWYFFTVSSLEEPKQQELAEVKEKIKETLVGNKAAEVRGTAVNEAREFIAAGLKEKKKIEDLVKEKKLTLSSLVEPSHNSPSPEVPESQSLVREGAKTAVGQISQAVDTPKGTVLIYVNAKELRKSDTATALRKQEADSLADRERRSLFESWFAKKLEEAQIKMAERTKDAA